MNPLVKLAASALPGERRYVLFAGAGVSKDAGVPTAWDLMLKTASLLYASEVDDVDPKVDLEKWFLSSQYAGLSYSEVMDHLYPNSIGQQSFLKQFLGGLNIGESHRKIAELARRGIIRAIVTTNFDDCIERALLDAGLGVQVISCDEDMCTCEPLIHCKDIRVYKPHGNLGKGLLRNTPKDVESLSPQFEVELTRVFSEHGVLVIGYSGRDPGMRKVLAHRNASFYPMFWVDPSVLDEQVNTALRQSAYTYIPCEGASQFLRSFLRIVDKIASLAPETGTGPTASDLEQALISRSDTIASLYSDFMRSICSELESTRPDFSQFSEVDEAIIQQLELGTTITRRFSDAIDLAARYKSYPALRSVYDGFGVLLRLYTRPDGATGHYSDTDFDGFKFLVYEMFVLMAAFLVRQEEWTLMGELYSNDLFVDSDRRSSYTPFTRISSYVASLEKIRNNRLNLRRISVMSDVLQDRFSKAEPIGHPDFMAGDYFLFLRTICSENGQDLRSIWCPRSCIFLTSAPRFIRRCESRRILDQFLKAIHVDTPERFKTLLSERHRLIERFFGPGYMGDSPLDYYDIQELGSRP